MAKLPGWLKVTGLVGFVAWLFRSDTPGTTGSSQLTARERIVRAARSQIGSSNADGYWWEAALPGDYDSLRKKDWCGAFVLWVLKSEGLAKSIFWIPGLGFEAQHLKTTTNPLPGDIAYFEKNQHRSIVESVSPDGTITTIDGNSTNGQVQRNVRRRGDVHAFFSIEGLL